MPSALPNDEVNGTNPKIRPGDVVRLKSGGPSMTVGNPCRDPYVHADENTPGVHACYWFVGTDLSTGQFHVDALEIVGTNPTVTPE